MNARATCADDVGASPLRATPTSTGPWSHERNAKLIDVLIKNGLNFRRNDRIVLNSEPYQRPFTEALAAELRRRGARTVHVIYRADHQQIAEAIRKEESPVSFSERVFPFMRLRELINEKYSSVFIEGTNDANPPPDIPVGKWAQYEEALASAQAPLTAFVESSQVPWTVIELPTPRQAHLVLPELGLDEAHARLKEMLADIFALDRVDPAAVWLRRTRALEARAAKLNALAMRTLRYVGPGTDLSVALHPTARWLGGRLHANGRAWQANFPTAEVYVTPMYSSAEGVVQVTRPVPFANDLIRGAWFRFKDGRVVAYGAAEGLEVLNDMFARNHRNRNLGEVAIVDHNSPVRYSVSFHSVLLDENARSHIALGGGYPQTFDPLPRAHSYADAEALQMNLSATHLDFVIGSPEMDIFGVTSAGVTVPLMKRGRIVVDFK